MSEWKTRTLGDAPLQIIDGDRGKNYPSQDQFSDRGYCLFLSTKNVRSDGFDFSECQFISKERDELLRKGRLEKDDLVLTTRGTVGNIGFFNNSVAFENIRINSGMVIIRPKKDELLPEFNYYVFRKLQKNFGVFTSGSAQPQLPIRDLNEIEIQLPPLSEQRAIGEVLSSLDDKIDLLHRQNKTLESLAETLFRHHFIDNAQDDWEKKKLRDLVDCYNGVSYKGVDLNDSSYALITLKSFNRDGSFSLDGFKEYTGKYKEQHIAEEKDLIVAHTDITQDAAIIGNPVLVYKPNKYKKLLFTMDIVKVKSKFEWLSNEFLYFLMRTNEFKEHCLGYSNGSTVLHLSKKAIPEFEFCFPSQEIIKSHSSFLKDAISKILSNMKQIQTLEKLRDTLLPKLISGNVRVQYEIRSNTKEQA